MVRSVTDSEVSKLVSSSLLADSQREEELDEEVENLHSTGRLK